MCNRTVYKIKSKSGCGYSNGTVSAYSNPNHWSVWGWGDRTKEFSERTLRTFLGKTLRYRGSIPDDWEIITIYVSETEGPKLQFSDFVTQKQLIDILSH